MITEDKIKRITASFLKDYYKYRPRVGVTEVRFDQSSGNIIADGHITFTQEDGKVFLATFEATSLDSSSEVIFVLRKKILFWDSFAFASAFSCLMVSILWRMQWMTVVKFGLFYNIIVFLGIWLLLFAIYGLIFMKTSRYRYIYAISQFKNYFADDQWIAVDEQIFHNTQDRYFAELKLQCTNSGFGIIVIDHNEVPRVVVAAARQDEFGNKRKHLAFGNQKPTFSEKARIKVSKRFDFIRNRLKPIPWKKNVMRFQGEHRSQTILGLLGIFLTMSIFYKQYTVSKYDFVDEQMFEKKLMNQPSTQEPPIVVVEQSAILKFKKQPFSYLQIAKDPISELDPYKGEADILMHSAPHMFTYYPCERVQNFKGNEVLLQLGRFSNFNNARKAVLQLTQLGIASNIIWAKCFDTTKSGYILTYQDFFKDENAAKQKGIVLLKKYRDLASFRSMKLILID